MKVGTHFGLILGPLRDMRRPDGVRARAAFVAISSVWSDLWRSKRVSWPLHRSQMSNVSSDAVTAISRELARPGIIWPSLHADEGGDTIRMRLHGEQSHAVASLVHCALVAFTRCETMPAGSLDHRLHDAMNERNAVESSRPNDSAANDGVEQRHAFLRRHRYVAF